MIDIKEAIELAKSKQNISVGGSKCFDVGDAVLVKYIRSLEYAKDNHRARDCEERVMEGINLKAQNGVNTPKHIAVERVIEGDNDVCYVLQEKCKGNNCTSLSLYGVTYEKMISDLEYIYNIPFDHYKKLISDCCQLYEMGYEAKNKNLFYDNESGFWFIDFLDYDKDNPFDANNPINVFKAIKHRMPNLIQIASSVRYDEELSPEQEARRDMLKYSIEAKTLLAIKSIIPGFEKYEKFYLFDKSDGLKRYLMERGIVKKDLFKFEEDDYPTYNELYDIIVNRIVSKIVNNGEEFWSVAVNDINNDSNLFCLLKMWVHHKDNSINISDFEEKYDYEKALYYSFAEKMLNVIAQKLEGMEKNENSARFLNDMYAKLGNPIKK